MLEGVQAGVYLFINKSLDMKAWEAKILAPNHIVWSMEYGESGTIHIYNVYRPPAVGDGNWVADIE